MTKVWVYAEVAPEGASSSALELLTKARSIGDEVAAVALGPGATSAVPALGEHGAARVYATAATSSPIDRALVNSSSADGLGPSGVTSA